MGKIYALNTFLFCYSFGFFSYECLFGFTYTDSDLLVKKLWILEFVFRLW